MITLLVGSNTFLAREFINDASRTYDKHGISRFDGSELDTDSLPELLQGASLFAEKRLVIIKEASGNKELWGTLVDWIQKIPEEVHLVLFEQTPDRRTKTFKALQKAAILKELKELNEPEAIQWLISYVKENNQSISQPEARHLVEKVGTSQWGLLSEINKLLAVGEISREKIDQVVEATPQANVFTLIDAALNGKKAAISSHIRVLETQEDPYRLFGLLASHVFQLAVLAQAEDISVDKIAKDLKTHPYPLQKLRPLSNRIRRRELAKIVNDVAELDIQLKSSAADPWLLLERALIKIAS